MSGTGVCSNFGRILSREGVDYQSPVRWEIGRVLRAEVITNGSAQVVSNNLYDVFGVLRYQQGSAETPWRDSMFRAADEGFYQLRSGVYAVEISKYKRGWRKLCRVVKDFIVDCGLEVYEKCKEIKEKCDLFKPVFDCTQCAALTIEAGRQCNHWLDTDVGFEWCLNHPKCAGNSLCCAQHCVNDWLAQYGGRTWKDCIDRCVDVVKKSWEVAAQ